MPEEVKDAVETKVEDQVKVPGEGEKKAVEEIKDQVTAEAPAADTEKTADNSAKLAELEKKLAEVEAALKAEKTAKMEAEGALAKNKAEAMLDKVVKEGYFDPSALAEGSVIVELAYNQPEILERILPFVTKKDMPVSPALQNASDIDKLNTLSAAEEQAMKDIQKIMDEQKIDFADAMKLYAKAEK